MNLLYPKWLEDPGRMHQNKLAPHAYVKPSTVIDLNGTWDFLYYQAPGVVPDSILDFDYPWHDTDKIRVPSSWQISGYGQMQYTDVLYPIAVIPPFVPDHNPVGVYHRTFECSLKDDSSAILRFYGVDSAFEVWVNGHYVGFSKIARNISEFDISPKLADGENHLVVKVYQWSDGS